MSSIIGGLQSFRSPPCKAPASSVPSHPQPRACWRAPFDAGHAHLQRNLSCQVPQPRSRHALSARCRSAASPPPPAASESGPLSEEQLRQLTEAEGAEEEAALGEAWRQQFAGDLEGLYDWADRGHLEHGQRVQHLLGVPKSLWKRTGLDQGLNQIPAGMATDLIGMGTWRLRGGVDPVIEFMTGRLEGLLREVLADDLALYPPSKWKDKGWDFVDSMDPTREWEGWAYADIPDPEKGEEGYPRLQMENRIYSSRVFRKIHLEVAVRQDRLHVLHAVFFPRYDFDAPILALDLVVVNGTCTLAIIDACPLSSDLQLPRHYMQTMAELQALHLPELSKQRRIPEWGSQIFSPMCQCISPQSPEELAGFIKYAIALTHAHLLYSRLLSPIEPSSKAAAARLRQLAAGQRRFCEQQLANVKTRRVLDVALGAELSGRYMSEVMFDYSPDDSPPWFDASIARLYQHFEDNPEPWPDAAEFLRSKQELDGQKARTFLTSYLEGNKALEGQRLEFALQNMYENDERFRFALLQLVPQLPALEAQGLVGPALAKQLAALVAGRPG